MTGIRFGRFRQSNAVAFVRPWMPNTIWLNSNYWLWVEETDKKEIAKLPTILSHESLHTTLLGLGELEASHKLDNRELFGTVETQQVSGIA